MPPSLPDLSRAEWVLMNICWSRGQSTARQIHEQASAQRKWEYQTVKTMLDRLVVKGYLVANKIGPVCLFQPAIARARVMGSAIDSFVDVVLDNTVAPLLTHLAKRKKLSPAELATLKKLFEEEKHHRQPGEA